jgi:lipopolysaccharide export system permease protein
MSAIPAIRPKLHDLYVGKTVLVTVLLVWAVMVGLDAMQALLSELGDVGKGGYQFPHALAYIAYTVPRRAYTLFPTSAVIGALMGLGQLAATSELTALRALGVSRRRLSVSVAAAVALLTALMAFGMETVGAWGENQANVLKSTARNGNVMARYSGLWAREGDVFLNAQQGDETVKDGKSSVQLRDVRLYEVAPDGRLQSIAHAALAQHESGSWLLQDVQRTVFHDRSVEQRRVDRERWDSKLDEAALSAGIAQPRYMAAGDLARSIDYRKRNGLDARDYEDVYWGRWFYPLNVLALCIAAIPFAFGSLRSGGLGKRLFLGILFALGFWVVQLLFSRMGRAFKLDFRVAYALPPVLMLAVSWWLFRRRSE